MRGLPADTCNIAQFVQGVGTGNSLGTFGQDFRSSVIRSEFKTLDYHMSDLLDEMRTRRQPPFRIVEPRFSAPKILTNPLFPFNRHDEGAIFALDKMQDLVSARAEECRLAASEGSVSDRVERLVQERVAALQMENNYRNSDQARFKLDFYTKELGYGPVPYRYNVITHTRQMTFPDGFVPQPDTRPPLDPTKPWKTLETWEEIDEDATIAQGVQDPEVEQTRKRAKKTARSYGKPPNANPKTVKHMDIISTNERMITLHEAPKGTYFACHKKPTGYEPPPAKRRVASMYA